MSKDYFWNRIVVQCLTSRFASISLQPVVGVSSLTITLTLLFSSITTSLLNIFSSPSTMLSVITSPKNRPLTPNNFRRSILNAI